MNSRILNTAYLSFPLTTVIAVMLGLFATPAAHAAARTWTGGNGDWQTGQNGGWSTGPWASNDTATFNVSGGGTVTVKSAITTGNTALAFTLGNYTLQSDVATERVVTLGNDNVTLGNGVTTTIGSNVTLIRAAALTFDGNSKATSTLDINSGGKAANSGAAIAIKEVTANVNTGGTIQSDASLVVGNTTDGAALNVLGGTVTLGTGNAAAIFALGNTVVHSPTVNFKITGGSLGFTDAGDSLAHSIRVGPLTTGTTGTTGTGVVTSTIDLEGGVVTVRGVYESKSTYSSTLNLHGGTLKALANNSDYLSVDNIWIKSGGAIFDSNGQSITVSKNLLTDVSSSGGGLTLNDSAITKGTLTLSGASITYTGPTLVNAGKLVVPSTHAGTGAATVSANATLSVTASGTSQWQPASLSLANSCTLGFNNVQNPGTTTAPLLPRSVVGAVTSVTISINSIAGTVQINNSYPLVGQVSATTGYTLGTQPVGVTGSLAISGTTLVYVVDSADVWTGADGTNPTFWDIATATNWTGKALNNTPAGSYAEGDNVRFDDTATSASPVTVAIQAPVAPGNMVFANSAKNYIFNGSFGIGGSSMLTKNGTGTLTLGTDNSYSGVTTVNQGTLSISHNNALGSNAGTTTISPTISGNANLVLNSATADLAVAENINFISTSVLRARLENTSAFNHTLSGSIYVDSSAAGAITEFNAATDGSIKISGNITGSVGTGSSFLIRGDTVGIGGVIYGNITLTGGGLTKTENGTWTIGASGKIYNAPIINVSAGILKMGADNFLAPSTLLSMGNSFGNVGTFDLNGFSQSVEGITNIGAGVDQTITSSAGTPVLTVDNPGDYSPANTILTGSLGLTKTGSGTFTLSGNNTYSGGTNVLGSGALALAHGSAAGSGTINFASTSTSATIPTFSLNGGIVVTNAMILRADTGRNTIHSLGGDNTLSGNITISNNAANIVLLSNYAVAGTIFRVGGATPNSTTITAATFSNSISFRCQTSGALGILNSQINAPNATVDANVNGNWTINSTDNSWAVTALSSAGIIKLGANDALATGAVVNLNGTGYVNLNGFNQTVAGLAGSVSTGKIVNHSTTSDSILTLAGLNADRNFIGTITDGNNGRITSLVMNSSGRTQTLSGANTYSGNTTVTAGTLKLSNAPDPFNANTANDASTVAITATGATLNLTFTGTDKVNKLVIGSTQQAYGVYGKVGSTLPVIGISQITGDGTLTVGIVTPAGFSSWITGTFANGTVPGGQQGPNDDFDKDGISNLVEYAIAGQDPTVPNATVGTFNAGTLSFSKRLDATGITYDIESSTLLTAESWTTLAKPPVVEIAGSISYSFTLGTPVKNFARLKVTSAP